MNNNNLIIINIIIFNKITIIKIKDQIFIMEINYNKNKKKCSKIMIMTLISNQIVEINIQIVPNKIVKGKIQKIKIQIVIIKCKKL